MPWANGLSYGCRFRSVYIRSKKAMALSVTQCIVAVELSVEGVSRSWEMGVVNLRCGVCLSRSRGPHSHALWTPVSKRITPSSPSAHHQTSATNSILTPPSGNGPRDLQSLAPPRIRIRTNTLHCTTLPSSSKATALSCIPSNHIPALFTKTYF
jgi:hypothetical protein